MCLDQQRPDAVLQTQGSVDIAQYDEEVYVCLLGDNIVSHHSLMLGPPWMEVPCALDGRTACHTLLTLMPHDPL